MFSQPPPRQTTGLPSSALDLAAQLGTSAESQRLVPPGRAQHRGHGVLPWRTAVAQARQESEDDGKHVGVVIENIASCAVQGQLSRKNLGNLLKLDIQDILLLAEGTSVFVRSEDPEVIKACLEMNMLIMQKFGATEPMIARVVEKEPRIETKPAVNKVALFHSLLPSVDEKAPFEEVVSIEQSLCTGKLRQLQPRRELSLQSMLPETQESQRLPMHVPTKIGRYGLRWPAPQAKSTSKSPGAQVCYDLADGRDFLYGAAPRQELANIQSPRCSDDISGIHSLHGTPPRMLCPQQSPVSGCTGDAGGCVLPHGVPRTPPTLAAQCFFGEAKFYEQVSIPAGSPPLSSKSLMRQF